MHRLLLAFSAVALLAAVSPACAETAYQEVDPKLMAQRLRAGGTPALAIPITGDWALMAFDDRYTAPLHGFESAIDYYTRCSALNFLHAIHIPTLIVNAQNDPFLSAACYPAAALKDHPVVKFESPVFGGHVGFAQFRKNGLYWSEERALSFLFPE